MGKVRFLAAALLFSAAIPSVAHAQVASDEELAKKLANPISSLISVPFQYNLDCCFGPLEADRHLLNFQPVIPTTKPTYVPIGSTSASDPTQTCQLHSGTSVKRPAGGYGARHTRRELSTAS
jgi:hypothetical protein